MLTLSALLNSYTSIVCVLNFDFLSFDLGDLLSNRIEVGVDLCVVVDGWLLGGGGWWLVGWVGYWIQMDTRGIPGHTVDIMMGEAHLVPLS